MGHTHISKGDVMVGIVWFWKMSIAYNPETLEEKPGLIFHPERKVMDEES